MLPADKSSFSNLGRTLFLLRDLKGTSQSALAKAAGVGKSQLSKYENGKELPRLDSLDRMLAALGVGYLEFFYTMAMVDLREEGLGDSPTLESPLVPKLSLTLNGEIDGSIEAIISQLMRLQRLVWEKTVLLPELANQERKENG